MTDIISNEELAADKKPESKIKRDRWGRYLLPVPETGEIIPWTRASTLARTLADNFALEKWMQRNLVFGIGRRKDLYAKAASVASIEEKDTLGEIVEEAFEAASSSSRANLGTALHRFTERIDAGEKVDVPDDWKPDTDAYTRTLKDYEISIAKDAALVPMSERIIICPAIKTAGTFDRLLQSLMWKLPRIGDLKTGSNAERNMGEFTLQLSIYANATHWWDPENVCYHEMPEIDLKTAVIMHLPVGKGDCTLWDIDIEAGWEAVDTAMWVRKWRNRKDLCVPTAHPSTRPAASDGTSITPITKESVNAESTTDDRRTATISGPLAQEVQKKAETLDALSTAADMLSRGAKDEAADQISPEPERPEYAVDPEYKFAERLEWVRARIKLIIDTGHGQDMAELWGSMEPPVDTFRKGGPVSNAQIDQVAGVCAFVEMAHSLSFHNGDPAKEKPLSKLTQELLI